MYLFAAFSWGIIKYYRRSFFSILSNCCTPDREVCHILSLWEYLYEITVILKIGEAIVTNFKFLDDYKAFNELDTANLRVLAIFFDLKILKNSFQ